MIRHHPTAEILLDHARGRLHTGESLVVACHLGVCDICRSEVSLCEGIGGVLLERLDPVILSDGARMAMLARLDEGRSENTPRRPELPAHMNRYSIPDALRRRHLSFRRWATPGIWFAPVKSAGGKTRRTYLVFAQRGTVLPHHWHAGREFTFVLHGSFSDSSGTFKAGDFAETDRHVEHAPAVSRETDCLCLISSASPMLPSGWMARSIQRLLGTPY
jgi:putative transcriptional regulator